MFEEGRWRTVIHPTAEKARPGRTGEVHQKTSKMYEPVRQDEFGFGIERSWNLLNFIGIVLPPECSSGRSVLTR
jgi:hypothetical protein